MRHDLYPTAMFTTPAPLPLAIAVSATVAVAAWKLRSLSISGAIAAVLVGTIAVRASYGTGIFLVAWFVLATALSKVGKARKSTRLRDVVEKSSQRDAWQVFANGGVFAALILVAMMAGSNCDFVSSCGSALSIAAAGALAAAGADTWATEIGTLVGGTPWSLRSASRVPAGTSGAITLAGTTAMFAGAAALAALAVVLFVVPWDLRSGVAVGIGGVVGALVDTLVGAWLQERRWCPRCTSETEQVIHRCGTPTVPHRGIAGLNNDVVNLVCTIAGATASALCVLV